MTQEVAPKSPQIRFLELEAMAPFSLLPLHLEGEEPNRTAIDEMPQGFLGLAEDREADDMLEFSLRRRREPGHASRKEA